MVPDIVKHLPDAPEDVLDWIWEECVEKSYLFYSRKENWARCSRCGETVSLRYLNDAAIYHNQPSRCPRCGARGIFKSEGMGRKRLEERFRVMICVPDGDKVVAVISEVIAEFSRPGRPEIRRSIRQVLSFSGTGCENWFLHLPYYIFGQYVDEEWEKRKTMYIYTPGRFGWYGSAWDVIYMYDKNLDQLNVGPLTYADIDNYVSEMELTPQELVKYMELCVKYPQSEKLRKFGCNNLIMDYINNNGPKNAVHWKGKTIQKMLRCNMKEAREIRDFEAGLKAVEILQKKKKEGINLTIDAAELWKNFSEGRFVEAK